MYRRLVKQIRRVDVTFGVFQYCVQVAVVQLQHMLLSRHVTGWKRLSVRYYTASLSFGHVVLFRVVRGSVFIDPTQPNPPNN